jgi:hypothetical protein
MIGQHQLVELLDRYQPQTIILPALQHFEQASWQALLTFVERGSTLLVSGVIGRDQHNLVRVDPDKLPFEHLQEAQPVERYEYLSGLGNERVQLSYDADRMIYVKKAHNQLVSTAYGAGQIFWSGLPLEQAHSSEVTRQVYQLVMRLTAREMGESPLLVIKQQVKGGVLVLVVSESSCEEQVEIAEGMSVNMRANRAGAVLLLDGQEAQFFGGVQRVE